MKRLIVTVICVLFTSTAWAQEISNADLKKMRDSVQSEEFKVKQNITTHSSFKAISTSRTAEENLDWEFTHVIDRGPVTNQEKSGRCWLFAGLNVVRYDAAKNLGVDNFEFSENHLFFFHKLELSNYLLEEAITGKLNPNDPHIAWLLRNGLSDGGYWDMFTFLFRKYGAVPKSVMPETVHSSSTGEFNKILDKLVKKHFTAIWDLRKKGESVRKMREYKMTGIAEIYQFLALSFGTPPETFTWRYKKDGKLVDIGKHTPISFAQKYAGKAISTKVNLMSDPTLEYYTRYILNGLKNGVESEAETFLNIPMDVLLESAKKSVLADRPVWFGSDVGRYANFKTGILDPAQFDYSELLDMTIEIPKAKRLEVYGSQATHAMVFMGVDVNKDGEPIKWLIENSWGSGAGKDGYLIMTTEWFEEYGFDVIVDKRFITPKVKKHMSGPVIELPLWHHLWRK